MHEASLMLLAGNLLLAASGGAALANVKRGTPRNDSIVGTRNADRLVGRRRPDAWWRGRRLPLRRQTTPHGGSGTEVPRDELHGEEGEDFLYA